MFTKVTRRKMVMQMGAIHRKIEINMIISLVSVSLYTKEGV